MQVPLTFSLEDRVSLWQDVEVYVGPEARPVSTAQFISDLLLDKSPQLDPSRAHKLGDLPNAIGQSSFEFCIHVIKDLLNIHHTLQSNSFCLDNLQVHRIPHL